MKSILFVVIVTSMLWVPAVNAEDFRIGVLVPLTGEGARSYGEQVKNSVLLAKSHYPASKVSLVFEDSKCDVKSAITAAKKLILIDKVQAIIGDVCWTDLIAPIAEHYAIPVIAPGSAQPAVRESGDYIFRLKLDVSVDSKELARTLRTRFDYKRAAVLYVGDQWGEGIQGNFSDVFTADGGTIAYRAIFQRDEKDFRPLLMKLKGATPDVILLAGYPENIGIIAKQLRNLGITTPLAGYRGGLAEETLELGGVALEGMVYIEEFDANSRDVSRQFAAEYRKKYGQAPNLFGAMGYDAYQLFENGFTRCNSDTQCIKTYLYSVRDFEGVSGLLTFDSFGDVVKPMSLFTIADGAFVAYHSALAAKGGQVEP